MLLWKDESPFELSWTAKKHKIKMLLLLLPVCVYVCVFVCKCRAFYLRVPFYLRAAALNWIFSLRSKLKWSVKDQRRSKKEWECKHGWFQISFYISHLNLKTLRWCSKERVRVKKEQEAVGRQTWMISLSWH